jgi:hypothetical protein
VRLHAPIERQEDVIIVMDLVAGEPLLQYVAGSEARLRTCSNSCERCPSFMGVAWRTAT